MRKLRDELEIEELEIEIGKLLRDFSTNTGLTVDSIDVTHIYGYADEKSIDFTVRANLKL